MELALEAEDVAFRDEARAWLADHVPAEARPPDGNEMRAFDTAWQRTLFDGGWAGPAWPADAGGRELPLLHQLIWAEEYARAGAPWAGCCFVAVNHAGPTLLAAGTAAQREAHLLPILRGEEVWCQGFSEPDAGSDLASLRTRAEVDGDHLVVNGRKIWSSFAHVADYQELLVRTDPASSRAAGLTFVICDLRVDGVEIHPIRTMAGTWDFAEVVFDEVRIPLDQVVGELHDGWRVTMTSLVVERGSAFVSDQVELASTIDALVADAHDRRGPAGGRAIDDDELRRRLGRVAAEAAALRALTLLSFERRMAGAPPGPDASIVRLFFSELTQRVSRLAFDLLGADAISGAAAGPGGEPWARRYARSYAETIGAGTKDIQRNIIGRSLVGADGAVP